MLYSRSSCGSSWEPCKCTVDVARAAPQQGSACPTQREDELHIKMGREGWGGGRGRKGGGKGAKGQELTSLPLLHTCFYNPRPFPYIEQQQPSHDAGQPKAANDQPLESRRQEAALPSYVA